MEKMDIKNHYYKYWTELIKPQGLDADDKTLSDHYGKFYIRPLEKGYGLTLGNAVRRVLLSSMMGSAVSAVKIDGVVHEFSTLPDVLEDVTDIVLNLKQVRFSQENSEDIFLKISKKGPGKVTASDIQTTSNITVLNPDQLIATLGERGEFSAEILVTFDRGYIPAGEKNRNLPVGYIEVDAIHSPIRQVNYNVSSTRVGQKTDYDSLTIEVWTDGSIKSKEALSLGYKILKEQFQVFIGFDENIEPKEKKDVSEELQFDKNLFRPVEDLELSVRSANCLKNARIRCIGELVTRSEQDMLKTKNFGRKSLNEIKDILRPMGFTLGMFIEGWPPQNLSIAPQAVVKEESTTPSPSMAFSQQPPPVEAVPEPSSPPAEPAAEAIRIDEDSHLSFTGDSSSSESSEASAAESPSTESPSTESPSTESPSTESPSTESPSTESENTESENTEKPAEAEEKEEFNGDSYTDDKGE